MGSRDGYFLTIGHGMTISIFLLSFGPCVSSDCHFLYLAGNVTVDTREVDLNMKECTFNVLTQGRRYTITVVTRFRNLSSSVSVEGWTGTLMSEAVSVPPLSGFIGPP